MTKETAKKKPTRKKKPEGDEVGKVAGRVSVRNLIAQRLAEKQKGSKTTRIKVGSADDMQNPTIELPHLALQYLFASRWFRCRTYTEVVGDEGLGKTTLALYFAGMFLKVGAPVHMAHTEGKLPIKTQMMRGMSPDVAFSEGAYDELIVTKPKSIELWLTELNEILNSIRATGAYRGKGKKLNKPVIKKDEEFLHILDTRSKLMAAEEAAGHYEGYSVHMTKAASAKHKSVSSVRPTSIAKEQTSVMRRLPYMCDDLGMTSIAMTHKNVRIDMGARPGAAKFAQFIDRRRPVTNGGNAPKQNAGYRIAMSRIDQAAFDDTGREIGQRVFVHMTKNSFGSDTARSIQYTFRTVYTRDTPDYLQPAIELDECLVSMMVEMDILNTTVTNGMFTCREFNAYGVSAKELSDIIHSSEENRQKLGSILGIQGYAGVPTLPPMRPVADTSEQVWVEGDEEESEPEADGEETTNEQAEDEPT